ncbi:MAG: CoA transferase, partial [Gammaproteobacteria bacterium]|nr:CoA transferase [Gammaproteobacteria bacterium]
MSEQSSQLPLTGYQVIEFGHYIAGPAVGMMLADLGADVVSITPPGGFKWNQAVSHILNRNKKIVEIDLKSSEGLNQAKTLVKQADLLIENFRPSVMQRLGLG